MLNDWVRSLILYLILSGLCLNLAPASRYKQYIRYFTGLVVLVMLAKPIGYMFHLGSGELEELLLALSEPDLEVEVSDDVYDYYDAGLRASLRRELSAYGVEEVFLVTYEDKRVAQITVFVSCEEAQLAEREQAIKSYIWEVYNVETGRIYVVRR